MKNKLHRYAIAVYAVALVVIAIVHVVPLVTGRLWGREATYLIQVFAAGIAMIALGQIVVSLYNVIRHQCQSRQRQAGQQEDQAYILRHAEDLYRQQGYVNRGSFGAGHIALQFSVNERDPRVYDALAALVEAGKLMPLSDPRGTRYVLPEKRQFEIIRANDLPKRWQERGEIFMPNDPNLGEIARVKRALMPRRKHALNP